MKKILFYTVLMMIVVILLPLAIVRGCSFERQDRRTEEKPGGVRIRVYVSTEDKVEEMLLEEYIKEVVAAEMPAEFEPEALKAQAVAARTYAYGRLKKIYSPKDDKHKGADICTDFAHCQAWIGKGSALKKWGPFKSSRYWAKIEKAIEETEGIIITYEGVVINPVFHSNSGGKTENAEDVWVGNGVPYLKSVESSGEDASSGYQSVVTVKVEDFCEALTNEFPGIELNRKDILKDIEILDYTEGNRVKTLRIGSVTLKGTEFRKLFSLRSANFTITEGAKNTFKITTIGNGHGVGMSQWGANYLAKNGGSCEEILKYYYQNVGLTSIQEYEGG